VDPDDVAFMNGIGLSSHDIITTTDRMVKEMLASPALRCRTEPAHVIIDSTCLVNASATRIDPHLLTDRLRVGLNKAAGPRIVFVGRQYWGIVERERDLKRDGRVSVPSEVALRPLGADYRLVGRIGSQDAVDRASGFQTRYHQITFELVDLETSRIAWSGMYEMKKGACDDVVYR
jgi:hypothetical protein